jgi:NADH:ubiquinone oxidoreductase subunit 5 (subunit L)/multisubunit Na+/H+ antiporter MnhA subunit
VDELYPGVVVEPLIGFNESLAQFDNAVIDGMVNGAGSGGAATSLYTGYFDNEVVDGVVNGTATLTDAMGRPVRRIQTGNIRSYIAVAVIGGLFVIAFFCIYLMYHRGALQKFFGG